MVSSDPRVTAEGTIAYLITFDDGFRVMYRDSGGTVTDYEKAALARVGRVDIAIAAVAASVLPALTSQQALEYMRTYKPDVYIPAHHDGSINELWRADRTDLPGDQGREPEDRHHLKGVS